MITMMMMTLMLLCLAKSFFGWERNGYSILCDLRAYRSFVNVKIGLLDSFEWMVDGSQMSRMYVPRM
jgi:hypothetical protein